MDVKIDSSDDASQVLDDLLEEISQRLKGGGPFDLESYVARYPQYGQRLRESLPGLELMVRLGKRDPDSFRRNGYVERAAKAEECPDPVSLGVLGDFRIVGELGRGGMGIVYEAEQLSLRRRVALKVLPMAAMLDPRQLARFQNEVHAAALLKHPNIVGVYTVGCERSVHFYSMELVEGRSLAEVIAEMRSSECGVVGWAAADQGQTRSAPGAHPTPLRSHDQTPSGGPPEPVFHPQTRASSVGRSPSSGSIRGHVPLTDTSPVAALSTQRWNDRRTYFQSVARLGVQAADALEYAHQSGVVHRDIKPSNLLVDDRGKLWLTDFGLAQVSCGHHITMSGDLLGTLRYMSPEQASGRRSVVDHRTDIYSLGVTLYELIALRPAFDGEDRQQLIRQILDQEPPPLRKLVSSVPRDLETIVLKAMSKDAAGRYASAQEMADDLRRYLDQKPILARRSTRRERLWRWCRRNPVVASLSAVLATLAVSLSIAGPWVAWNQRSLAALARAEADRATQKERELRQLVDRMLTRTAESLDDIPSAEPIRRELLQDALEFYRGFLRTQGSDPTVRYEAGHVWMHVGIINSFLGDLRQARAAFQQAIEILTRLTADCPHDVTYQAKLAEAYLYTGIYLGNHEPSLTAAADRFREVAHRQPDTREYRAALARAYTYLAATPHAMGRFAESEKWSREALSLWERLASDGPLAADWLRDVAYCHSVYGHMLKGSFRFHQAKEQLSQAVELGRRALETGTPDATKARFRLAESYSDLAVLLAETGQLEEAERNYLEGIGLFEDLARRSPDVDYWRKRCGHRYRDLSDALLAMGRLEEGEQALLRSLALAEEQSQKYTDDRTYDIELGSVYYRLGVIRHWTGRLDAANEVFAKASSCLETYAEALPSERGGARRLIVLLATCPSVRFRNADRAWQLAEKMVRESPDTGRFWHLLGVAACQAGESQEAIDALNKFMELRRGGDSFDRLFLAEAYAQLGQREQALEWYHRALEKIAAGWRTTRDFTALDLMRFQTEIEHQLGIEESPAPDSYDHADPK